MSRLSFQRHHRGPWSGNIAAATTTTLPAGDALQATYPGDINYNPSKTGSVNVTVASILLTKVLLNPSTYGQTVTFVATVPAGELGSVTFKDSGTVLEQPHFLVQQQPSLLRLLRLDRTTSPQLQRGRKPRHSSCGDLSNCDAGGEYRDSVDCSYKFRIDQIRRPSNEHCKYLPWGNGNDSIHQYDTVGYRSYQQIGIATISISTLPAGSDPITATYGGDGNYNSAVGSTAQFVARGRL